MAYIPYYLAPKEKVAKKSTESQLVRMKGGITKTVVGVGRETLPLAISCFSFLVGGMYDLLKISLDGSKVAIIAISQSLSGV